MTKTTTTSFVAVALMASALIGVTTAHASEVTGTLSSDASSNEETSGNISGTVTGASSGSSSGGGSSSSGGRSNRSNDSSSTDAPDGEVLGASTDTVTPGFPNAGFNPVEETPVPTLWSRIVTFFSTMVSSH